MPHGKILQLAQKEGAFWRARESSSSGLGYSVVFLEKSQLTLTVPLHPGALTGTGGNPAMH